MKCSGYCFYMSTDKKGDFQICISVPLKFNRINNGHKRIYPLFLNIRLMIKRKSKITRGQKFDS